MRGTAIFESVVNAGHLSIARAAHAQMSGHRRPACVDIELATGRVASGVLRLARDLEDTTLVPLLQRIAAAHAGESAPWRSRRAEANALCSSTQCAPARSRYFGSRKAGRDGLSRRARFVRVARRSQGELKGRRRDDRKSPPLSAFRASRPQRSRRRRRGSGRCPSRHPPVAPH